MEEIQTNINSIHWYLGQILDGGEKYVAHHYRISDLICNIISDIRTLQDTGFCKTHVFSSSTYNPTEVVLHLGMEMRYYFLQCQQRVTMDIKREIWQLLKTDVETLLALLKEIIDREDDE